MADETEVRTARRPGYPYRLWYGAPHYETHPELYPFMTIVHAGKASPQSTESDGKTYLEWAFGTNIGRTDIARPDRRAHYYSARFAPAHRTRKPVPDFNYRFTIAGAGFDEWIFNKETPDSYIWVRDGLHAGRCDNPDVFAAIWAVDMGRPEIFQTISEDSSDLIMVEGYDLAGPGLGVNSNQAIARLEDFAQRGLIRKVVMGLGHITDAASWNGQQWDEPRLRARMEEVKRKFPESPGISFFPGEKGDEKAYMKIMKLADALSGEYWPDLPIPDGYYSITPQTATTQRLEVAVTESGEARSVASHRGRYPQDTRNQKWRFVHLGDSTYHIKPAAFPSLCLDAKDGARPGLAEDEGLASQIWRLAKVTGGYRIIPLQAPDHSLQLVDTRNGSAASILPIRAESQDDVFALAPEILPHAPVPPYYQAEDADLGGGADTARSNTGYVGSGYVRLGNGTSGREVRFTGVDGGPGGVRTLVFRYALAADADARTTLLAVNGTEVASITFRPTDGDWRQWENHSLLVRMEPGPNNTVTLRTNGSGGPDLDKLTIHPPIYRHPDFEHGASVRVVPAPWGGDGAFLDMQKTGSSIRLAGAEGGPAGAAGRRSIRFRYANGSPTAGQFSISINGTALVTRFPSTGGWDRWQEISVFSDALLAGPGNEIVLTSASPGGIHLETLSIDHGENRLPSD